MERAVPPAPPQAPSFVVQALQLGIPADQSEAIQDRVRLANLTAWLYVIALLPCAAQFYWWGNAVAAQVCVALTIGAAAVLTLNAVGAHRLGRVLIPAAGLLLTPFYTAIGALDIADSALLPTITVAYVLFAWTERAWLYALLAGIVAIHVAVMLPGLPASTLPADALTRHLLFLSSALMTAGFLAAGFVLNAREQDRVAETQANLNAQLEDRSRIENQLRFAWTSAKTARDSKTAFLSAVSHEMRTPLNGLLGMNDVLRQTELTTEQAELLELSKQSGTHLLQLIDNAIDYARLGAGQVTTQRELLDLCDLVEQLVQEQRSRAEEKHLGLYLDLPHSPLRMALGDSHRIRQLLHALLDNALKFTAEGHIVVRLRLAAAGDATAVTLEVQDTGEGIPADQQDTVLDGFTMRDASLGRSRGGVGLGLTLCREITRVLGGTLELDSTVGKGSTFRVTLTLDRAVSAPLDAPAPLQGMWISLLSPDATLTAILRTRLTGLGAGVHTAPRLDPLANTASRTPPQQRAVLIDARLVPKAPSPGWAVVVAAEQGTTVDRLRLIETTSDPPALDIPRLPVPVRTRDLHQLAHIDRGVSSRAAEEPSPRALRIAGKRVLVAEDNPVNSMILQRLLQGLQIEAAIVPNGAEAVKRVQQETWDVVLMDLQMPVMDGISATRHIRALPGAHGAVPIIAVTANAGASERSEGHAAGINAFLEKPVSPSKLLDMLTLHTEDGPPAT